MLTPFAKMGPHDRTSHLKIQDNESRGSDRLPFSYLHDGFHLGFCQRQEAVEPTLLGVFD